MPTQAPQAASPSAHPTEGLSRPPWLDADPTEAWPAIHRRLQALLQRSDVTSSDFMARLEAIEDGMRYLLGEREDDSLFVMVQMLFDRDQGYSAGHALMVASLCQMIGPRTGVRGDALQALTRAALTMNIAMSQLQDQLAGQVRPVDSVQRAEIDTHAEQGVERLKVLGVTDQDWLSLVNHHHAAEHANAVAEPLLQCLQLLQMADRFVARISPRRNRRGLPPKLAAGNLYLEAQEQASTLGAAFVKLMGMYPPGTYVRLKSEETAVIVRRGERVNTPLAMAIADSQGMPLSTPSVRDTEQQRYQVEKPVSPEDVRIRLDKSKLLRRL